jgi:hypothetical protein
MDPHQSVYQAVVARRMQWDSLLWQVPILSLTAQAFLFTIALGSDTSELSRIIAALLSAVVALLCVSLMARHRQAELSDAGWLQEYEKDYSERFQVHGEPFRERRDKVKVRLLGNRLPAPTWPGYEVWTWGVSTFGVLGLVVVVLSVANPTLLHG